jgi:hypothetical protein
VTPGFRACGRPGSRRWWRRACRHRAGMARGEKNLTLIGEDEVENGILVSRLVLAISDKVSWELKDLRLRVASLEGGHELADTDVLKPATFAARACESMDSDAASRATAGRSMQDSLAPMVVDRLFSAYQHANEFLIRNGDHAGHRDEVRHPSRCGWQRATAAVTSASKSPGSARENPFSGRGRPGNGDPGCRRIRRIRIRVVGRASTGGSARGYAAGASTDSADRSGALSSGSPGPSTRAGGTRHHPQQRSGRRDPHDDGHHAAGPGSAAGTGRAGAAQAPVCRPGCRL